MLRCLIYLATVSLLAAFYLTGHEGALTTRHLLEALATRLLLHFSQFAIHQRLLVTKLVFVHAQVKLSEWIV